MIAYLLYNKGTADERTVQDYEPRLKAAGVDTELTDADSPRGIQLVESYDIMGRPAIALIRTDGSPVQVWQGTDQWPAIEDVSYLAHQ